MKGGSASHFFRGIGGDRFGETQMLFFFDMASIFEHVDFFFAIAGRSSLHITMFAHQRFAV